uniref:tyrosine-type recombinase/integrase n=1 Tax=Humibacter albus TaxID=427754 RepID=UPI0003B4A4FA
MRNDEWTVALDGWRSWLIAAHRASGTIYQHLYRVGRLERQYAGRSPWSLTTDDIIAHLREGDLSASTQRARRTSIRGFYAWAVATGRLTRDPSALLPAVHAPLGKPRPAPDEAVEAARFAADVRVRVMVQLGARAGLRCCEICRVHVRDVEADMLGWSLRVLGKGGRTRVVPLPDDLAHLIVREADASG